MVFWPKKLIQARMRMCKHQASIMIRLFQKTKIQSFQGCDVPARKGKILVLTVKRTLMNVVNTVRSLFKFTFSWLLQHHNCLFVCLSKSRTMSARSLLTSFLHRWTQIFSHYGMALSPFLRMQACGLSMHRRQTWPSLTLWPILEEELGC